MRSHQHAALLSALLAACLAAGCGKKEEPKKEPPPKVVECFDVQILDIERRDDQNINLLEFISEQPIKQRISRVGNYGKAGDKFNYCE